MMRTRIGRRVKRRALRQEPTCRLSTQYVQWHRRYRTTRPEVERSRAVPPALVEALKQAGVFRMYVPASHGGTEMTPIDVVQVLEEIARADGSVGWIAAIGANSPAIFAYLPAKTYDEIYSTGPDVILAGSLLPRGTASGGRRRLPFHRPMAVHERLRTRRLRRDQRVFQGTDLGGTQSPPPGILFAIAPVEFSRDRRHVARQRTQRHREPRREGSTIYSSAPSRPVRS